VSGIKDLWSMYGTHFSFKLKIIKHMQTYSTMDYVVSSIHLIGLVGILLGGLFFIYLDFKNYKKTDEDGNS
jgi:hypothetical protein